MSTTDFLRNVNPEDLPITITKFFDELMLLYNLVGYREDLNICPNTEDVSLATFVVRMETEEDANRLFDELNQSSFSVYDQEFDIFMNRRKTCLDVTISKKATL